MVKLDRSFRPLFSAADRAAAPRRLGSCDTPNKQLSNTREAEKRSSPSRHDAKRRFRVG